MKLSPQGYALLKEFEGLKLNAYLDSAKIPTIGYGSTYYEDGTKVKMGDKITRERAEKLLPNIVKRFENAVNGLTSCVKQHEFDALVCFMYNIGISAFTASTMLKKIKEGKPAHEIASEFGRWNKAGGKVVNGLSVRRHKEALVYEYGYTNA